MTNSLENPLDEKHLLKMFFYALLPLFAIVAGMNLLFPTPDSEQYEGFYNNLILFTIF